MPALIDTLESSFTSGGFSLDSVVGGLGTAANGVAPQGVSLDQGALGQIGQQLHQANFSSIGSTVTGVVGQASAVGAAFPETTTLLGPLTGALGTAGTFATADPHQVLGLFEHAASAGDGALGMTALAGPLAALSSARSNEPLGTALRLLTTAVPGGVQLDATISRFGDQAEGIAALVRLVGALMSTEALTRELTGTTQTIGAMLDGPAADAAIAQLQSSTTNGLAALIVAASPDDPDQVAAVVPVVTEFADAIRGAAGRLVDGMAFGEATLVGASLDAVSAGVTQASGLLTEAALDPVRKLATEAAGWIEPALRIDLGTPAASVDAFVQELTGLVGQIGHAIDRIDPDAIARPVSSALNSALAPLHQLQAIAQQVSASIRSALQTAQHAISSIDLRPVTQAIQAATQPVVDALRDLDQLVGAAQTELQTLANDLTSALTTVRQSLDAGAQTIQGAVGRVQSAVDGLNLGQLQTTIQSDLQAVAQTLGSAQVEPYFNTAIQALNTAKSVVGAVPVSLLPDDTKQELDSAVQPIKDIDFDTDVRQVLEGQLDAILTSLNTDVLDEIEQAYQEVVTFVASIDPRPPLEQFEHDDFDPMLARIRAVDPTEILKPVSDLIDEVKGAVAGIDLRRDVLAPLENAFDQLQQAFSELDPSALLAPIEQQVGQLRDQISQTIHLPQLQEWLALVDPAVAKLLGRLDFDALVSLLDAAWSQLKPAPDPPGTSPLATVVSGLLEGTGMTLRMDSLASVTRWIGGADASAEITARLTAAAAAVDSAVEVLQRVDPQSLVASVQPTYTAVTAAVQALPAGSLLQQQLEPVLAGASPMEVLGTTVDNRNRYLGALTSLQTELHGLAASARSELTAIAHGLRDALRPLAVIPDRIKALFIRIGLQVTPGKSLRELVGELFDLITPARLLAPLSPAIATLKAKVTAFVHTVLVAPAGDALTAIGGALAALDLSFIRTGLQGLHDQIAAEINQLRPSVLLASVLTAFDQTKATIAAFDPLAPVRTAIDAMKAAIDDVANHYRPTVLFASVFKLHDEVVKALGTLDVRDLLDPILKALDDIKTQLDTGLDGTAAALTGLQGVLP
jgi:hypothetical protein